MTIRNFSFYSIALILSALITARCNAMEIKVWVTPNSDIRAEYEIQLLTHLLEITSDEFGEYRLKIGRSEFSYDRGLRKLASAEEVNIFANPISKNLSGNKYEPIIIDTPLMKGLLGYRLLIINANASDRFKQLKTLDQLKSLSVGQPSYWIDTQIYNENKFLVETAPSFERLFDMLKRDRIDYIPLGAGEIDTIFKQYKGNENAFIISNSEAIYYPFPVFFHISKKTPEIAQRIRKGIELSKKSGGMDKIFKEYFSEAEQHLSSSSIRVFVLKNTFLNQYTETTKPQLVNEKQLIY